MNEESLLHPAADALLVRAVNIVERTLRAPSPPDSAVERQLRADADRLEGDLVMFERAYRAAHGADARIPTTRAWYLVKLLREHGTLLRDRT